MYGLGGQMAARPGTARMMRPHNPLMNMGMARHLAEGGSPDDGKMHAGTQHNISPQVTIGALLRRFPALWGGAAPAQGAPVAPAAPPVAAPAIAAPAPPYAHGGGVRRYDEGGIVSPVSGAPMQPPPAPGAMPGQPSTGMSPLMQQMLRGYQAYQAQPQARSPFAPAQPNPAATAAPGAAPAAPGTVPAPPARPAAPLAPKPFNLPGGNPGAASMVPQRPIQPGLMQGRPMAPQQQPAPTGQPIVPFMQGSPGFAHGGSAGSPPAISAGPGGPMMHARGPGGGQDDSIDAKLSDGEVVWPSDVVSHVGDGSNSEGAKRLMSASDAIRAEKAASSEGGKYPKPAKGPLHYIHKAAGKKIVKKAQGGLAGINTSWNPPAAATGANDATMTGVRG